MTLPARHDLRRLHAHAVLAGDRRLAELIVVRLSASAPHRSASLPPFADPLVRRIMATLQQPPRQTDDGPTDAAPD